MTQSSELPQTPRRSWLKRALGLLLICVLLLGAGTTGGLFWLRSAAGERWVRETITTTLQQTGITAEIGQLSGPLPEALHLQNVRLSDGKGLWFSASEALIRLDLWEILTGTLRIETIILRNGHLIRTPILPPTEAAAPPALAGLDPQQIQATTQTAETLAEHIVCGELLLEHFLVGTEGTVGFARINANGEGPLNNFSLHWEVSSPLLTLKTPNADRYPSLKGTVFAGTKGAWRASEGTNLPKGPALKIQTNLAPIFFPEEQTAEAPLTALISMGEGSLAINILEAVLPGGRLSLHEIRANTEDLKGMVLLTLSDPQQLADAVQGGNPKHKETGEAPQPMPQAMRLKATLSGSLASPHCELTLNALSMPLGNRTNNATLALTIALRELLTEPALSANGSLDITSLFKPTTIQGTPSETATPATDVAHSATPEEAPSQTGLHIELNAHANKETASLELTDSKANLLLSATGNIPAQRGELRLELGDIQELINELTAWVPALKTMPIQNLAGRATLKADVQQTPAQEERTAAATAMEKKGKETLGEADNVKPVTVTLSLQLEQMHWPLPQVQGLLGPNAALTLSGSVLPDTGTLHIDKTHLSGKQIQITGHGTIRELSDVDSQFEVQLADLSALDPGLSGTLKLDLQAHGPMRQPAIALNLKSPRVAYTGTTLQNLHLGINSPHLDPAGGTGTIELTGTVSHTAMPERHSVPLRFHAAWDASSKKIQLKDAALNADGLSLLGDATVHEGKDLSGGCRLTITDWNALSLLTGVALQGQPAQAELRLTPEQNFEANWHLGSLLSSGFSLRGFTGSARFAPRQKQPRLHLEAELNAGHVGELAWKQGTIAINGPLSMLDFKASLSGRTRFNCAGQLNLERRHFLLSQLVLSQRRQTYTSGLKLSAPATISFQNGISVDTLRLDLTPSGSIRLAGQITPKKVGLTANLQAVSLSFAQAFSASPLPEGLLNGEIALSGSERAPNGTIRLQIEKLGYKDSEIPPAAISLTGNLSAQALHFNASMDGFGPKPALANVTLPLHRSSSGIPELNLRGPLSGQASWEGALPALWRFVPLANTALAGHGIFNATFSGTLSNPRAQASFVIQNADFEDVLAGLQLTGIDADVQFDSNETSTLKISAGDGQGGTVEIDGTLGTLAAGFPLSLTGTIKKLAPLHRSDLAITLSGNVSLNGPLTAPAIAGAITVDKGQYTILSSFGTSIPTLDVVDAGQTSTESSHTTESNLNIQLIVPKQFFVRGAGLDSEWKGALTITGPVNNPVVLGGIASVRGNLSLLGKDFVLTKSKVSFTGATPPNPMLDIEVICQAETITAEATIRGSASSPSLTLSSHPPLPTDEIVAQILFGQGAASLGRMEALQLAAELASLAGFGTGGSGLLGGIRDSLGIDVLRFGSIKEPSRQSSRMNLLQPNNPANAESESIPALEVGKYIADGVYVGVEQGISDESTGVRIEIELAPNLNLEASTTPKQSEIGVTWKKDYK